MAESFVLCGWVNDTVEKRLIKVVNKYEEPQK